MQPLGFGAGAIEGGGDLRRAVAGREVTGKQVTRVVVDDGDRVPPPVSRDVQISDIGLPQLVRLGGQQLEQTRRLIQCRFAYPALLQQPGGLEHPVDHLVAHCQTLATRDYCDTLVSPPRVAFGQGSSGTGFGLRPGFLGSVARPAYHTERAMPKALSTPESRATGFAAQASVTMVRTASVSSSRPRVVLKSGWRWWSSHYSLAPHPTLAT